MRSLYQPSLLRYPYSRTADPTCTARAERFAAFGAGTRASAFASGPAAKGAVIRPVCAPGGPVITPGAVYGGCLRLFAEALEG